MKDDNYTRQTNLMLSSGEKNLLQNPIYLNLRVKVLYVTKEIVQIGDEQIVRFTFAEPFCVRV